MVAESFAGRQKKARLDPAAGLIWVMAVSTVAAAAIWAGRDYSSGRQYTTDTTSLHAQSHSVAEARILNFYPVVPS